MNTAPKYGKINVHFNSDSKTVVEYEDCGMFISGNHLVIVIDTLDSVHNTQTSKGIVYQLDKVEFYETFKQ